MSSSPLTTSQRFFAMGRFHVLIFLCSTVGCLAEECLAADEATSGCFGVSFIQKNAQSSRTVTPLSVNKEEEAVGAHHGRKLAPAYGIPVLKHKEHTPAALNQAGEHIIQEPEEDKVKEEEKAEEKVTKEEETTEKKDEQEGEEKPVDEKEAEEMERAFEEGLVTEENAEEMAGEKAEGKAEGKAEEKREAEENADEKTEETGEPAEKADEAQEKREEGEEMSEGPSEEGVEGAKEESEGKTMDEHLHGWLEKIRHPELITEELEKLDLIKNKKEYWDAAYEKYGRYNDHKNSNFVYGIMVATPAWFILFCVYCMCCSKSDRDYSEYRGSMHEKLSDYNPDSKLGPIGRVMEQPWFRMIILASVLVDVFCLFVIGTVQETDWLNPKYKVQGDNWVARFRDVNICILCGFLIEQFLHSLTHGKLFFRHFWYILDLVGSYVALVAAVILTDLYPRNRLVTILEMLPVLRMWNVVAIILDLLVVTALAVEHEDEEVMEEEAVAEEMAKEKEAETKPDGQ